MCVSVSSSALAPNDLLSRNFRAVNDTSSKSANRYSTRPSQRDPNIASTPPPTVQPTSESECDWEIAGNAGLQTKVSRGQVALASISKNATPPVAYAKIAGVTR